MRSIYEKAFTRFYGSHAVLGITHMSSRGLELELDASALDRWATRWRTMARYRFGPGLQGWFGRADDQPLAGPIPALDGSRRSADGGGGRLPASHRQHQVGTVMSNVVEFHDVPFSTAIPSPARAASGGWPSKRANTASALVIEAYARS